MKSTEMIAISKQDLETLINREYYESYAKCYRVHQCKGQLYLPTYTEFAEESGIEDDLPSIDKTALLDCFVQIETAFRVNLNSGAVHDEYSKLSAGVDDLLKFFN